MQTYSELNVDANSAYKINMKYYSSTSGKDFMTMADTDAYPAAFASYLYRLLDSELPNAETIKVLELGPRGIYFEEKLYSELLRLDKTNSTSYSERINYTLLDIAPVAIENAKSRYEINGADKNLFPTEFKVGDAINSRLPQNADVIIANELIDDFKQLVVAKRDGKLYEVVFKIGVGDFLGDYGISLRPSHLRPIKKKAIRDIYLKELDRHLPEGFATTFSPDLSKFMENLAQSSKPEATIAIHDYFILGGVGVANSNRLKRVFGNMDLARIYSSSV
ncbi:MAG: hypothetical protein QXK65_01520, partial [Candidatus Micrarchaeaceae archaeon]